MKLSTPQILTVTCGLALVASTLAGTAGARGSSGHVSSGASHISNRTTSMSRSFSRTTRVTGVNRGSNFRRSSTTRLSTNSRFRSRFVSSRFRSQRFTTRRFLSSRNRYWRNYGGWATAGRSWGGGYGWGWGSWDSPWCYGWTLYEPIPAVAYYNPYCACAGNVVDGIDYSVPIAGTSENAVGPDDSDAFAAARAAYAQGDFGGALKATSAAVMQAPHNQDVHQFHSLVLFAMGSYCKSATVAHAVLEEGPGWTWDTLQTFYPSPEIYTEQLRQLEHYVGDHPSDANVRFLLGYHYLVLNHVDSAKRQLAQVINLEPQDKLAANILNSIQGPSPDQPGPTESAPMQPIPARSRQPKIATGETVPVQPQPEQNVAEPAEHAPMQPIPARRGTAKLASAGTTPIKPVPELEQNLPKENTRLQNTRQQNTPEEDEEDVPERNVAVQTVAQTTPVKAATVPETADSVAAIPATKVPATTTKSVPATPAPVDQAAAQTTTSAKPAVDEEPEENEPEKPTVDPTRVVKESLVADVDGPQPSSGSLTGTWKANPTKAVQIEVTLRTDKTFTWKFTANGRTQSFSGKYELGAKSLVLTREDGESMDGTLEREGNASFKFRMKDADPDDPGLTFSR
jgi:hypothetical protein